MGEERSIDGRFNVFFFHYYKFLNFFRTSRFNDTFNGYFCVQFPSLAFISAILLERMFARIRRNQHITLSFVAFRCLFQYSYTFPARGFRFLYFPLPSL